MKYRAIINPAIRPAIANLEHKLTEEATDLADDVRLEESSLLASCEGFLLDALYSSERVKEILWPVTQTSPIWARCSTPLGRVRVPITTTSAPALLLSSSDR